MISFAVRLRYYIPDSLYTILRNPQLLILLPVKRQEIFLPSAGPEGLEPSTP